MHQHAAPEQSLLRSPGVSLVTFAKFLPRAQRVLRRFAPPLFQWTHPMCFPAEPLQLVAAVLEHMFPALLEPVSDGLFGWAVRQDAVLAEVGRPDASFGWTARQDTALAASAVGVKPVSDTACGWTADQDMALAEPEVGLQPVSDTSFGWAA